MLITLNKLDKHAFSSHSSQYISHGTNKEKLNNNPERFYLLISFSSPSCLIQQWYCKEKTTCWLFLLDS